MDIEKDALTARLLAAQDREIKAYYAYVAEQRGDNSRGRRYPSRVKAAEEYWYTTIEELNELKEEFDREWGEDVG